MNKVVTEKLDDLIRLCKQFHVGRLELFGSAAAGVAFDARRSDVDFLVEFLSLQPGESADAYFSLLFALQELFGRNVDLVMVGAVRNPYFLESINRNQTLLYAA